jgi:hypothetical protein
VAGGNIRGFICPDQHGSLIIIHGFLLILIRCRPGFPEVGRIL